MPKRSTSSPALYELFRSQLKQQATGAAPPPEPRELPLIRSASSGDQSRFAWLEPGRVLRLPMGVLFVAAALVLVFLIGSYLIGYKRGESYARTESDQNLAMQLQTDRTNAAVQDPLTARNSPLGTIEPRSAGTQDSSRTSMGPVESDPRKKGVNYFIVATYPRSSALELAEFCRQRGLEAYVVRDNNTSFKVFVLPGYVAGDRQSPSIKALEEKIKDLGRQWYLQGRKDNLTTYYPEKYQG